MKKIFNRLAVIAFASGTLASCSFLDVSDEALGGLNDFSQVFNDANRTRRWYSEVFANIPDYSGYYEGVNGMKNTWAGYTDEMSVSLASREGKYGNWNSTNGASQRWKLLYERIRQANYFLEMAKVINPPGGPNVARILEEDLIKMKGNVRFMRAAYHYYLMELYGPIPIIDHSLTLEDDLRIPRNSLDEVINWIDAELVEAMATMEQEPYNDNGNMRAVPTRATAMALRAKLWVYAASPLFNGGFTEALALKNPDGKKLFPAKDNGTKLDKAVSVLREFLDYAEAGRFELYKAANNDPATSLYELFQTYNHEIIWASSVTAWGTATNLQTDNYATPRCEQNGMGGLNILQELVDDFYTAEGYPIEDTPFLEASTTYTEQGFGILDGFEVSNMYIGREPRFYNTVTFSGKKWHVTGNEVQFYKGGNADNTQQGGAATGYLLYKRFNRTVSASGITGSTTSFVRPSIIFRLAEFYLLYAEMLNEKEPANSEVLEYLNLVRERAGLPDIEELNPGIAGNQELQRQAIRRESRIELATEGQRYFDVRRWMIAEQPEGRQGGDFHGMNTDGDKTTYNTRKRDHTRVFMRKNYLYPIPQTEVLKSEGQLVQNPGW